MSENIIIFVVLGIFALVFVGIGINYFKKRSSEWKATVIDKDYSEQVRNHNTVNRGNFPNRGAGPSINIGSRGISIGAANQRNLSINYFVKLKSEQGKEFRWKISEAMYEKIQIGDTLEKKPGTTVPTIIATTSPQGEVTQNQ